MTLISVYTNHCPFASSMFAQILSVMMYIFINLFLKNRVLHLLKGKVGAWLSLIDRTQRSNFAFTGIFRRREQLLHTSLVAINLKVFNSFVSVGFSTASPTSLSALSTPVKNTRYPRKRETHKQMIKTFWSLLIFLEEKRKINASIRMLRN